MPTIETSIDVYVAVETGYDQWKRFEKLPEFMKGIKQFTQLDNNPLEWKADKAGQDSDWEPEITGHTPVHSAAQVCQSGDITEGVVAFQAVSDGMSKVLLQFVYSPDDRFETTRDKLRAVSSCMQDELTRFKAFAECIQDGQGTETTIDHLPS